MQLKSHRRYYLIFWFTVLIQLNISEITVYHENKVFIAFASQARHKSNWSRWPQAARRWRLCWIRTWSWLFTVRLSHGPESLK